MKVDLIVKENDMLGASQSMVRARKMDSHEEKILTELGKAQKQQSEAHRLMGECQHEAI